MGAYDDLIPAGRASGGLYDDLIPPKRDVGIFESAGRGLMERGAQYGKVAGLATATPFVLADVVGNLFRDQPSTTAQDFAFSRFVDPSARAKEHWAIDPASESQGLPAKIAGAVAPLVIDLPLAIGTGGSSLALPATARTLPDILAPMFTNAARTMRVPAGVSGTERAMSLTEQGVPVPRAVGAGAMTAGATVAGGALPLSVPGNLARRVVSGAAGGAGAGELQRIAENLYLPSDKETPFSWENVAVNAAPGAVLGGILGPRGAPQARGREAQGYDATPESRTARETGEATYAADFERFRPFLEANGISDPESIAAQQAVGTLRAREERQRAAAEARAQEPRQPDTPAEQVPEVRGRPEVVYVTPEGEAINSTARGDIAGRMSAEGTKAATEAGATRAFDVAERQAGRKQEGQDQAAIQGEPRDLSEARAGGTTTKEGTAAVTPERFTFLDAQIRNGQMAEGARVELVEPGLTMRNEAGKDVPASRVRMEDGSEVIVADTRLSARERPANPRFAQDIAATVYEPPRGAGTGPDQPQPRAAGQRITTEASPEFIPGDRGKVARPPHQGETIDGEVVQPPAGALRAPRTALPEPTPFDRPQAAAEPEAPPAPQEPGKRGGSAFLGRLKAAGGISSAFALEVGRDSAMVLNRRRPGLFRKDGMSEDGLLEWLEQYGYLSRADIDAAEQQPGGALQLAKDTVRRALDGEDVSPLGSRVEEGRWEAGRDRDADMEHERQLLDEAAAEHEVTPAEVEMVHRAAAIDEAAVERAAIQYPDGGKEFTDAISEIIAKGAAGREGSARAEGAAPESGAARDAAGPERDAAGPEIVRERSEPRGRAGEDAGGLELEQPTAGKLRGDAERADAAERDRARVEDAPPPSDYGLTGSDRPADQARARGQGELYGGIPKPVVDAVAKAFDWATADAAKWAERAQGFSNALKNRAAPVWHLARAILDSSSGDMRAKLRAEAPNSKAAQWVLDQFHTEAGSDRVTGEIYSAAVDARVRSQLKLLNDAIGKFAEADDTASLNQIANLVRNPGNIKRGTAIGDAAASVRALLDEQLKYMKAAGVDIGEVKGGYFPREIDGAKVGSDSQGFIDAATRAYRENGLDAKVAGEAARQLHDAILYGDGGGLFAAKGGGASAPFLKSRVFGKSVDQAGHPLNKFLVSDPALVLPLYLQRAARRAEIARRFGDRFSHWHNEWKDEKGATQKPLTEQMRAEGGGNVVGDMADYITLAAGLRNPGTKESTVRAMSMARTWASLMFLEKATLSSLTEFIVPAMRSGDVREVARSLRGTLADLIPKMRTADAKERRAFAEDLSLISGQMSDTLNAARWSGADPSTQAETKVLDAYFKRTGLHQWTEATRVAAADLGRVFLRRQAKGALEGGKLAKRHLAELGISAEQAEPFAKWLLAKNDGMATGADLAPGDKMADTYRVAIRRFVSQGIMAPDATLKPAYMRSPLGSIMGQLQSFNYAFWENVLKRTGRLTKEAITGEGYTAAERAQLVTPALMLPLLVAVAYGIGEARDAAFGDPNRRKEETGVDKVLKAASRGMPIAPLDPFLNYLTAARYNRDAASFVVGPGAGKALEGLDAARDLAMKNSPNTNTTERKFAREVYDLIIEPSVNLALSLAPGGMAARALKAAATQAVGSGTVREELFVKPLTGEKREPRKAL